MSEDLNSHTQLIPRLRELLTHRYRMSAGAMFTMAIGVHEDEPVLLSGRIIFLDQEHTPRERLEYEKLSLVEEWISPCDVAVERLEQLLGGKAQVAGKSISPTFGWARAERTPASYEKHSGWPEWVGTTSVQHGNSRPSAPAHSVVAFGKRPFVSGRHAIAEWVWGGGRNSNPHENELMIILPDTRARIAAAEWKQQGGVVVQVEANVPASELELQVLFRESSSERDHLERGRTGAIELSVPPDTESMDFYLLHQSGANLGELALSRWERKAEPRPEKIALQEQVERDLASGENEEVEFKPFIAPNDVKENELLETVVAFSNMSGGRLYLGLDDHRTAQGARSLCSAFKGNEAQAKEDLVKRIRKIINDKLRPVPKVSIEFIEYRGEPVAVIDVQRGRRRPYATDSNEIYIRKGSSNVRPDPTTELRSLISSADEDVNSWAGDAEA